MHFSPYINFYGRCEEALEFYKSALGGSYEIMRSGDSPYEAETPEHWKSKVMHSTFRFDGGEFMASDGGPDSTPETESNISLSIATTNDEETERIFTALSAGGKIEMPLEKTFWTSKFGMLVDKFGIYWMVSSFSEQA